MKNLRAIKTFRELFSKTTEKNAPEWDSSVAVTHESGALEGQSLPASLSDEDVLSVSDTKSAAVLLHPSDEGAVYGVTVYGWCASTKGAHIVENDAVPMAGAYKLDGGTWEGLSGRRILGIDCQLYDGIFVWVDELSVGSLTVEIVSVLFEEM